jgi:uncharacterized protein (UPF0335 family)
VFYLLSIIRRDNLRFREISASLDLCNKMVYMSRLFVLSEVRRMELSQEDLEEDIEEIYGNLSSSLLRNTSRNYFKEIVRVRGKSSDIRKDLVS